MVVSQFRSSPPTAIKKHRKYKMPEPNPWSVAIKVTLYMFDVISDLTNGVLMLTADGQSNSSLHQNSSYICDCSGETGPNLAWGSLTIGLSWVPAIFGLIFLIRGHHTKKLAKGPPPCFRAS